MLISTEYKFICFNPPRTGTGFRETVLDKYCIDNKLCEPTKVIQETHRFCRHLSFIEANHMRFKNNEIKKYLNDPKYFKFTYVRNPWKRYASWYNYHLQVGLKRFTTFKDFILSRRWPSSMYISKHMNYIGDTDDLSKDLPIQMAKIGLKLTDREINLAELMAFRNKIPYDYKEMYTPELIDLVAIKERDIINLMSYTYE